MEDFFTGIVLFVTIGLTWKDETSETIVQNLYRRLLKIVIKM